MKVIEILMTTLLACKALSQPYEYFPLSEQLPNVARVGQDYSFQISNYTYASDTGPIIYSTEDLPNWLSFDSLTRTFTGTPNANDVSDSESFILVGTDANGELRKSQPFIVSNKEGPKPSNSYTVLSQLADFGQTNGNNGLVLSPGEVFNITFDSNTFTSDDPIVAYYGKSSNRTPLPSWLFFDSLNLRFSGVAPTVNSEIASSLIYNFILIATDYTGYFGNSIDFEIIVGAHKLSTSLKETIYINGSTGDVLDFPLPLKSVYEDNKPISISNISNIELNDAPDWVKLDNYTLIGDIPNDFNNTNIFSVTIQDFYSNSVSLYFQIQQIDSLFTVSSFRSANATRGSYFQYYFLPTDFTDFQTTNVTVNTGSSTWLKFHQDNLTLTGETPNDFDLAEITIKATSNSREDILSFQIYGIDAVNLSSSQSSSSNTTDISSPSTSTTITNPNSKNSHKKSSHKALAIGLGVGLGSFVILVAALLMFCCFFRKRGINSNDTEKNKPVMISNPILGHPANSPQNMISPEPCLVSSPALDHSDDDESLDEPQRLGALNVLKLDAKGYYDDDDDDANSSTTNVASIHHEDSHSSLYQDAVQSHNPELLVDNGNNSDYDSTEYYNNKHQLQESVATKSWRQSIEIKNRESLNSLASVSTNELLSMRLAEDNDLIKDPRKSTLNNRDSAFLSSTDSSILTRDDSGNFQRLDSDGNIVGYIKDSRQRASKATNLDILDEETTPYLQVTPGINPDVSANSLSTGEEFFPIGEENGDTKWRHKSKFTFESNRRGSLTQKTNNFKARLMTFNNKGRANTSKDVSTGEDVEFI